ncbi:class I SAM-dependent methyltransferase [Planktothrix sp. FACHB-1355]|uniref:Class I SAM-dependent methyltransferase n=1 Tax=Aerosakkonema funiforme FACHB-1375 TaxID=2949571 RepID=A0A926ZIG8_9CYAN|nr:MULTISPECIES: class I SAM-dependent methyltransferase [Oscillatoriales]MBD2183262.1 class I SAM-dependent methyltransferase [Aerosakkonema funiforme FACHB-1375]MBD3561102.1 class I SAM-dependent methyltransferase [Planktothrix sp. FACHB-1355]
MKVNTTYEPYSQQPEYLDANRELLRTLSLDSVRQVLDLACGTGVMTSLLFELKPDISVIGIDLSAQSLEIAREDFQQKKLLVDDKTSLDAVLKSGKGSVMLMQGSADELPFESESVDLVVMGGAIHLISDKHKLLSNIQRVLRFGGMFTFNTVFYVGTYPEGTEKVYTEWLKESLAVLEKKNEELRAAGKETIKRQRGKVGRAFDKGWMSPSEWGELLKIHGLVVNREYQRSVMMTKQSFETVGAYGGLSEVLMSGYPVEIASECLQEGANRAFSNLGITEIPRYWLEIVAVKQRSN